MNDHARSSRLQHGPGNAHAPATADAPGTFGLNEDGCATHVDAQRRQQDLSGHQLRLLRQVAANYPLATVLDDLCATLEAVSRRPLRATVMLREGERLRCVAAPGLPPGFRADRNATGLDGSGTACAEAVRSGRRVVIADTAQTGVAPEIAACRQDWGFGAVWSYPVIREGEAIGTLALMPDGPGEPNAEDERLVEFALEIVRLALARERDAAALRDSEQRFRDFAELSADWFWEQDAEFRFTEVNYGPGSRPAVPPYYDQGSFGKRRWDLPYVSVPEGFWEEHRRRLEDGQPFNRLQLQRRDDDGGLRHVEISGRPLFDAAGRLTGYRGTGRDITGQVAAREELEKTRLWLEQAIRAANIGLWERDADTWDFHFTSNWKSLFGYAEDEFDNGAEDFDRLVHPDDLQRIQTVARAYMDNPQGEYQNRFRVRHKDGNWRWVLSRGHVLTDPASGRRTWMGCHLDITEQKRAEEALVELNETLEARVSARTAALEEANRELDAFNFSVSHDLRAPLRAIEGFSRILLEDYPERLDAAGQDYLLRIGAAAARMGELIAALHDLARLGRTELHLRPVDLSALARELTAELRQEAPGRHAQIDIADTPAAEGDPRLLRAALANLLDNAWKYTAKRAPAHIAFGARTDEGGRTVYFVRDNGAGFDMQFADKLFKLFQRLHREEEFGGRGVGLVTAERIVRRHGGRIWAEAGKGRGATFFFTLGDEPGLRDEAVRT